MGLPFLLMASVVLPYHCANRCAKDKSTTARLHRYSKMLQLGTTIVLLVCVKKLLVWRVWLLLLRHTFASHFSSCSHFLSSVEFFPFELSIRNRYPSVCQKVFTMLRCKTIQGVDDGAWHCCCCTCKYCFFYCVRASCTHIQTFSFSFSFHLKIR
jgi:hypothetical protein